MEKQTIKIGTRGSRLALWQAEHVKKLLTEKFPALQVQLKIIRTKGDAGESTSAQPGIFTGGIEEALEGGSVDIAVHSLKDLPVEIRDGLHLAAVPERENPADALVASEGLNLGSLPKGATVLTGSPRRRALVLECRPDIRVEGVRGNVPTRIDKMHDTGADALVLACAGLVRLGLEKQIAEILNPTDFIPAPGQGALGIQTRADDDRMLNICSAIDHFPSRLCVTAERAFFHAIGAGCHAAAGALGKINGDILTLTGMVPDPSSGELIRKKIEMEVKDKQDAANAGYRLAELIQTEA